MIRQLSGAAAAKVVAVLASYAAQYTLVLVMTQAEFGRFSLLMAVASIVALVISLGHPQVILRSVAMLRKTGRSPGVAAIWRWSHVWIISISTLLIFTMLVLWFQSGGEEAITQLLILGFIVFAWALLKLHSHLLQGAEKTTLAQVAETCLRPLFFALSLIALALVGIRDLDAVMALFLNGLAFVLAFIVTYLINIRLKIFRLVQNWEDGFENDRNWFSASLSMALISAAQLLILNVDILMISQVLSDIEVAQYRVAILIATIVGGLNEVIVVVIRPRIAAAYADKTLQTIFPTLRRLAVAFGALGMMALIVFVFCGRNLLEWAFGPEYSPSYWATVVLVAGQVVATFLGPVGSILNMTNQENTHFRIILSALALNILLNLILIPSYGIVGAAIASFFTFLASGLAALCCLENSAMPSYLGLRRKKKV